MSSLIFCNDRDFSLSQRFTFGDIRICYKSFVVCLLVFIHELCVTLENGMFNYN